MTKKRNSVATTVLLAGATLFTLTNQGLAGEYFSFFDPYLQPNERHVLYTEPSCEGRTHDCVSYGGKPFCGISFYATSYTLLRSDKIVDSGKSLQIEISKNDGPYENFCLLKR